MLLGKMGSTALFLLGQPYQNPNLYLDTYLCGCFTAKRIINQPGVILFIVYFLKIGSIVACFTIHRNCD